MSINNTNGLGSVGNIASSALNSFGKGMNAIAHNVANVNTAGFNPLNVNYQNRANNMGVSAQAATTSSTQVNEKPKNNGSNALPPEVLNPSGTDLARTSVQMISTENAFEANAVTIKVWDSMLGDLINMKV